MPWRIWRCDSFAGGVGSCSIVAVLFVGCALDVVVW
jgi:hypothetical protein